MTDQHAAIFAELPEDFIRRMSNWARDRDGGRIAVAYLGERVDGWRPEVPIPTMEGEAADTQRAVLRLPQRHQEVVACFWMHQAQTLSWMATATPRLRLWKLGPASFREWLRIGHVRLQIEIGKLTVEHAQRSSKSAAAQAR